MPRSRFSIALYLILVFASGILVGAVSHRLYSTNTASANAPQNTLGEFRKRYLDGMRTQVGASEEQLRQVTAILEDTRRKLDELSAKEKPMHDEVRMEHIEQIRALLNDKQKIAYDNWRAERARQAASQSAAPAK
jgi:uncharacterized protein YnzC (UPF0291/DUF896 family)